MTHTTLKRKKKKKNLLICFSQKTHIQECPCQLESGHGSLLESFSQEDSFVLMQPCGSVLDAGIKSVNGNSQHLRRVLGTVTFQNLLVIDAVIVLMFHDQLEFCTSSTITLPHQQGYREACDQGKQSTRAVPFYHIAETFVCPLFSIGSSNYAKDALDLYFMPFCVIGPGSKQTQKDKYDE